MQIIIAEHHHLDADETILASTRSARNGVVPSAKGTSQPRQCGELGNSMMVTKELDGEKEEGEKTVIKPGQKQHGDQNDI